MAASMRDGPPTTGAATGAGAATGGAAAAVTGASTGVSSAPNQTTTAANFEYDDNEWDIGIGDLIIDLDADIEKTGVGEGSMAAPKPGKMHSPVEHQATVDKGLKMKIKRTKPGTKHEIVKSGENGEKQQQQQQPPQQQQQQAQQQQQQQPPPPHMNSGGPKRGSSGHKRDKKHGASGGASGASTEKPTGGAKDVNGVVRCVDRVIYPIIKTPPIGATCTKDKEPTAPGALPTVPTGGNGPLSKKMKTGSGLLTNVSTAIVSSNNAANGNVSQVTVPSVNPTSSVSQCTVLSPPLSAGTTSVIPVVGTGSQLSQVVLPISVSSSASPITSSVPSTLSLTTQLTTANSQAPVLSPAVAQQAVSSTSGILANQAQSSQVPPSVTSAPAGLPQLQLAPEASLTTMVPAQHSGVISQSSSGSLSPPPLTLQVPLPLQATLPLHLPLPASVGAPLNQVPSLQRPPTSPSPTPPPLNHHLPKELVDVCVGTSVGTITEPDCLGPCEPGTSVTLEGIVWQEVEGVLVVNVTWRGKTYVGTLLDCTKHDWAPPRIMCDSPTSDMDARTPKGRGKRGRNATHSSMNDLSNFTETRSSVHSKLRSNNTNPPKGGRGRGPGSASPTPFATPKSEGPPGKRKTSKPNEDEPVSKKKAPPSQPTSPLPPPTLLECPEPNCSKKYKHINGLKYHKSHAHGCPDDEETKESMTSEEEAPSPLPELVKKEEPCESSTNQTVEDGLPPETEDKGVGNKYSEETSSPLEPSPPVLTTNNSVPPIIVPTTPPPPAPSPSPVPVDDNASMSHLGQGPPVLTKVPQFKVKPASALMPEEKKSTVATSPNIPTKQPPVLNQKKKSRKSPTDSPDSSAMPSPPNYEELEAGREEMQSPAYSDISDDAAPLLESEVEGKAKPLDKKEESPQLQHFGIYPYYGQPPYLVPSVSEKPKDPSGPEKAQESGGKIVVEKEKKEAPADYQQKMLPQHYYQFNYHHVPNFSYNMDGYPVVVEEKKDEKPPTPSNAAKSASTNSTLHIPNPTKPKLEPIVNKDKHPNENHQILKESIDLKNQVSPGFFYRPPPRPDEVSGGYYAIYPESNNSGSNSSNSKKESMPASKPTPPPQQPSVKTLPSPSTAKHKEKSDEKKERRDEEKKQQQQQQQQEGVKPTMETQGPPPPPTSQYAYIHPGYMQAAGHYGALPFEPAAVYRGMNPMLVSGYPPPNSHYLHHAQLHPHAGLPRYGPEDLSRSQSGKALDLLQHHASQYYAAAAAATAAQPPPPPPPSHKIHELQERAIKSPTPNKTSSSSSSSSAPPPMGVVPPPSSVAVTSSAPVVVTSSAAVQVQGSKLSDAKDARSPPPQRHVHTHHHTHVGLGYPILAGQYAAPYGAAVLATEHAATVTSVPYQTK